MPQNVEIKARVESLLPIRETAAQLCCKPAESSVTQGEILNQEDVFFATPEGKGRLKLRRVNGKNQLIYYERADDEDAKASQWQLVEMDTSTADDLAATLTCALGVDKPVVKKKRVLYLYDQTRIHLDEVDGLGNFVELEVVMRDGQPLEEGVKIANDLMEKLGISPRQYISGSYADWLQEKEQME